MSPCLSYPFRLRGKAHTSSGSTEGLAGLLQKMPLKRSSLRMPRKWIVDHKTRNPCTFQVVHIFHFLYLCQSTETDVKQQRSLVSCNLPNCKICAKKCIVLCTNKIIFFAFLSSIFTNVRIVCRPLGNSLPSNTLRAISLCTHLQEAVTWNATVDSSETLEGGCLWWPRFAHLSVIFSTTTSKHPC